MAMACGRRPLSSEDRSFLREGRRAKWAPERKLKLLPSGRPWCSSDLGPRQRYGAAIKLCSRLMSGPPSDATISGVSFGVLAANSTARQSSFAMVRIGRSKRGEVCAKPQQIELLHDRRLDLLFCGWLVVKHEVQRSAVPVECRNRVLKPVVISPWWRRKCFARAWGHGCSC